MGITNLSARHIMFALHLKVLKTKYLPSVIDASKYMD